MFRRVHHRLRSKRPSSEPHPQHAESQSGPPVQTTVSTETGVTKPQDAVGTIDLPGSSLSGANVPVDAEQSRDLWEEAFAKLDNDKKDLLSKIENPHGGKVVEQVAEQTEQIYREREERGWKISRSEGKSNINLRAAFKKILTSILKFKELISAGMACEPTGHAAAAWTIVSLGLQMVKNDADLRSNILETCGKLAENLALLAATETNYRRRTVPDSGSLEDAIVTVYVAILELSAAVVQENSLNMGRRIFRSFTALPEQPLHDFNDALESKKAKLKEWTDIIKREYQAQEAEDLDNKIGSTLCKIEELAQQVSNIATKIFSAEELSILDWLSKYDFSDSHSAATSRREDDTGAWILRLPEYKAWKVTDSSLLWLYGNCK